MRESETVITSAIVSKSSILAGKRLRDLNLPDKYGAWVIAIKKGNKWIYGPDGDNEISAGDFLIVRCPAETEEDLVNVMGKKVEWETYED